MIVIGRGRGPNMSKMVKCPISDGTGTVETRFRHKSDSNAIKVVCPTCNGSGKIQVVGRE